MSISFWDERFEHAPELGCASRRKGLGARKQVFPQATIVLTLGADGAIAREPGGQVVRQSAFLAEEVERLGVAMRLRRDSSTPT